MSTEAITSSIISEMTTPKEESLDVESLPNGGDQQTQDPDTARRLAIFAKKEKSLLQRQQELQQKLKEIEEKEQRLGKYSKFDELNEDNFLEFAKTKGMSLEKVQQKWLESLQDEDIDPVQKQIKELRQQLTAKDEEFKKLLEERLEKENKTKQEKELEEQSRYYNQELKKFISDRADDYDLINTFDAAEEVFNVIKTVYLKTSETGEPKLMTFDEACNLYEKKLEELVQGMTKSKKVSKIFGADTSEDPFAKVLGQTTLDDSFSQSSSTSPEFKTEHERLRAAARLFEQQIKQG